MIIELNDKDPQPVYKLLEKQDLEVYYVRNCSRRFVVTSGDDRNIDVKKIKSLQTVRTILDGVEQPYFFASKAFRKEKTIIHVDSVPVGGKDLVIIAGPCAVENREDTLETAKLVKRAGAHMLRGGAFKPRTTPYNFQGLKEKGLEILAEAKKKTGLPIVSEVMSPTDVEVVASNVDLLQVGTRNMTNSSLLKSLGKVKKPILLKRGFSSPIKDLLKAAEFIIVNGNPRVILCERGILTFETHTRYTLDIGAVVAIRELSHLPIIVDPSHGTGRPSFIPSMSNAAIAVGADGLLIESHVAPERMLKPGDGFQALRPSELKNLIDGLRPFALAARRRI